jgi:DNA-directed RNA polymerase specialized sigma24 family protein
MTEADWLAVRFEEQRPHLRAVAYRMLGSLAEADDAVQNSWLRLSRADTADVGNLAGWLTTVVARECLKMLRTRRSRREEPLVGPALMVVLDTLAPGERLAFVLHDIFAMPFDEIAPILQRSPAAARQLASRARRRVHGAAPPQQVDRARQRQVADAFLTALREGDFDALIAVLDPDVVLRDDSAGLPGGAAVMHGARPVGAYALKYSRAARFVKPALVNGAAGLAIVAFRRPIGALGFTFRHDRIAEIQMISDPGRLRQLDLAAPDG